jgi:hypothetical protein
VSSPANSDVDIPARALLAPIGVINGERIPYQAQPLLISRDLAEAPPEQGRPSRKRKRTEAFGVEDYGPETSVNPDHAGVSDEQAIDVIKKGLITDAEAQEFYAL